MISRALPPFILHVSLENMTDSVSPPSYQLQLGKTGKESGEKKHEAKGSDLVVP